MTSDNGDELRIEFSRTNPAARQVGGLPEGNWYYVMYLNGEIISHGTTTVINTTDSTGRWDFSPDPASGDEAFSFTLENVTEYSASWWMTDGSPPVGWSVIEWHPIIIEQTPDNPGGDDQGGDDQGGDNQGGSNQGGDDQGGDDQGGSNQGGDDQGGSNQGGDNQGGDNPGGDDQGNEYWVVNELVINASWKGRDMSAFIDKYLATVGRPDHPLGSGRYLTTEPFVKQFPVTINKWGWWDYDWTIVSVGIIEIIRTDLGVHKAPASDTGEPFIAIGVSQGITLQEDTTYNLSTTIYNGSITIEFEWLANDENGNPIIGYDENGNPILP